MLGIADLMAPDYGEPMEPLPDEVALYWGRGLTVQVALADAGIASYFTHAPGQMLVTDRLNAELAMPLVVFPPAKVLQ